MALSTLKFVLFASAAAVLSACVEEQTASKPVALAPELEALTVATVPAELIADNCSTLKFNDPVFDKQIFAVIAKLIEQGYTESQISAMADSIELETAAAKAGIQFAADNDLTLVTKNETCALGMKEIQAKSEIGALLLKR